MFSYILKRKIHKMQSDSDRITDSFQTYAQAHRILLLCQYSFIETLQPHIKKMKQDGKNIEILAIDMNKHTEKDKIPDIPDTVRMLNRSDFGRYTSLPSANVVKFVRQHIYDVMIDTTIEQDNRTTYLAYIIKASCKMGFKKNEKINPYQFMVQSSRILMPSEILENLLFYWKKIDIKNNNS